jgi:hypothetical protein
VLDIVAAALQLAYQQRLIPYIVLDDKHAERSRQASQFYRSFSRDSKDNRQFGG